jgi:hypothetical protein
MRISPLEAAAILAIGMTTLQLQPPEPEHSGLGFRQSLFRAGDRLPLRAQEGKPTISHARDDIARN